MCLFIHLVLIYLYMDDLLIDWLIDLIGIHIFFIYLFIYLFMYVFIYVFAYYLLKASIPVNRTGSPQGYSLVQNLHKKNNNKQIQKNKQNLITQRMTNNTHLKKKSISGIALVYNTA